MKTFYLALAALLIIGFAAEPALAKHKFNSNGNQWRQCGGDRGNGWRNNNGWRQARNFNNCRGGKKFRNANWGGHPRFGYNHPVHGGNHPGHGGGRRTGGLLRGWF